MAKITMEMTKAAYQAAKEVYHDRMSKAKAVYDLSTKHGLNGGSASDFIERFKKMMEGEKYTRTSNKVATDYFLTKILCDYDVDKLGNAIEAVKAHVDYEEGVTGGVRFHSIRAVMAKYEKILLSQGILVSPKRRIYTDVSVIGGCCDVELEKDSNKLFSEFISGNDILVTSDLVSIELEKFPQSVKDVLNKVPDEFVENLLFSKDVENLAKVYLEEDIIPSKRIVDARHIAIATINKVDVLVSWNFKYIVNLNKINDYNSINLKLGYQPIEIRTPTEVLTYEI